MNFGREVEREIITIIKKYVSVIIEKHVKVY